MVSATLPVAAVQGPWQMNVRLAHHLAPNSIKVHAPKIARSGLTMNLKPWNVKVSFLTYSANGNALDFRQCWIWVIWVWIVSFVKLLVGFHDSIVVV